MTTPEFMRQLEKIVNLTPDGIRHFFVSAAATMTPHQYAALVDYIVDNSNLPDYIKIIAAEIQSAAARIH